MTTPAAVPRLCVAASLAASCGLAAAAPGRTAFLDTGGLDLRWDNVEGPPVWVDGEPPVPSELDGWHLVRLEPGMSVTVKLSAGQLLRVQRPGRSIEAAEAAAWVSDGSGLEVMLEPLESSGPRSLLYFPASLKPMLVRLVRPVSRTGAIDFGLFVSRLEIPSRAAGSRDLVELPAARSTISASDWPLGETWWRSEGKPLSVLVKGPAILALRTRLLYPREEAEELQDYEVRVIAAGRPLRFELEAAPDRLAEYLVDGEPAALGLERTLSFEVPAGAHEVRIDCAGHVCLRLLRGSADDYLLSAPAQILVPPPALEPAAIRLVRDGALAESRLLGALRLRQAAAGLAVDPVDRSVALAFCRRHTQYRSLLPAEKRAPGPLDAGWFAPPRLLEPGEPAREVHIADQHLEAALGDFSLGWFVEAPRDREEAHAYDLPPRSAPSILRLAVLEGREGPDSKGAAVRSGRPEGSGRCSWAGWAGSYEWMVQLDGGRPATFRFSRRLARPASELQPAAAAQALERCAAMRAPRRSNGLFAAPDPPPRIVEVASAEIPLPPEVRQVRVWSASPVPSPPVALQYLCGAAHRATELEYFELLRRAGEAPAAGNVLVACYRRWIRGEPPPEPAWAGLSASWEPLFRFLSQAAGRFESGAVRPEHLSMGARRLEAAASTHAADSTEDCAAEAVRLAEAGEWLPALEAWSREIASGDPAGRSRARLERVKALEALGEQFLAERQLRGMYLFDEDDALRREALERLIALYRRSGDADPLVGSLVTSAVERGDPEHLRLLAETSALLGEQEVALQIALSLPAAERPQALVARSAARLGWWRAFGEATGGRNGLAAPRRQAAPWKQAAACKQAAEQAPAASSSLPAAERAQATAPPLEWAEAPELIADSAGGALAYNPGRDLFQQYHRASPGRPVKVRVAGPRALRIEARPLHPAGASLPVDGWLLVRGDGWLHPVAVNGNLPARGIVLCAAGGRLAGTKVAEEVSFRPDAGELEVEIESRPFDILVRVLAPQPEVRAAGLSSLEAVAGRSPRATARSDLPPPFAGRDLLPSPADSSLGAGRLAEAMRLSAGGDELPARGEDLPPGGADLCLRRALTVLLYAAEQDPCLREEARALGDGVFKAHPGVPGLQALHLRLMGSTGWRRVASVRGSAGIRGVEVSGWQPESPDLRVRRALLAPLEEGEKVITAGSDLVISLAGEKPALLELDLSLEALEYLPRSPLTVACRIDAEEVAKVLLSPGQASPYSPPLGLDGSPSVPLRLSVPSGRHAVRLQIEEPVVNQFVRVRALELKEGERAEPLSASVERAYFVSTREEPLRLAVEGPAVLQVDELRDGLTLTRHPRLPAGWQEVVLAPEGGRPEALFRVFQRVDGGGREAAPPPPQPEAEGAAPAEPPRDGGPSPPGKLTLEDAYVAGQEDGTFSLEALLARRRLLDEDGARRKNAENYLELGAAYRYFNEPIGTYFESRALVRVHESSGPAIGVEEDLHAQPSWLPFALRAAAAAYGQWPEGPAALPEGPFEWSGLLRAGISRRLSIGLKAFHVPSALVFARYLSLDDDGSFRSEDLDQDVFTEYKDDHPRGLILSETVGVQPWRDVEWWARASVTTNRSLSVADPDHASAGVGWKQFVSGLELEVEYRYTRFLDDADRRGASDRHSLSFRAHRDFWCAPRDRLEAGIELRHDFPDDLNTGFIFVAWHFSSGRNYRDFRPGEVDFLELRKALSQPAHGCRISEARHE